MRKEGIVGEMSISDRFAFSKSVWFQRIFSVLLICIFLMLAITEIFWFCVYVVPIVSDNIFAITGVSGLDQFSSETPVAIGDFNTISLCILFGMWVLPSLFFVLFSAALHYKFFMFLWRKVLYRAKVALSGTMVSSSCASSGVDEVSADSKAEQ